MIKFPKIAKIGLSVVAFSYSAMGQNGLSQDYLKTGMTKSSGNRVYLSTPQISIVPPANWELFHKPDAGVTLKMVGPINRVRVGKDTYRIRPNIQVRTIYKSEPIDEQGSKNFLAEMEDYFSKRPSAANFQILQSERIDFRGSSDALLTYSAYDAGSLPMIQMHFLVASESEQYVITYTDSEKLFRADSSRQDLAWNIATSIDYEGSPKPRFADAKKYGSYGLGALLLLLFAKIMRAMKHRRIIRSMDKEELDDFELNNDEFLGDNNDQFDIDTKVAEFGDDIDEFDYKYEVEEFSSKPKKDLIDAELICDLDDENLEDLDDDDIEDDNDSDEDWVV